MFSISASASDSRCKSFGSLRCQSNLFCLLFFSPFRVVTLHFSSASGNDCNPCKQSEWPWWLYPLRARTSCGGVLSHDNFVTVAGSGRGSGRRGEDGLSCGPLRSLTWWRDCWPCRLQLMRLQLMSAAVTPVVPVSR